MHKRVRTTISVSPETLEIFKRMSEASNTSVSRCMGDWLTDTGDAAVMIMMKMEEAKKAPMRVLREFQSMISGMNTEANNIIDSARVIEQGRRKERSAQRSAAFCDPVPPSSNTGVLVPPTTTIKSKSKLKSVKKI